MDCVHDKHVLRTLYEGVEGEEARGGAGDYAGAYRWRKAHPEPLTRYKT